VESGEGSGIRRVKSSNSVKNVETKDMDGNPDVTQTLQRRLDDILARFESLNVECRYRSGPNFLRSQYCMYAQPGSCAWLIIHRF
jgi:hypothetical protein